MSNVSAGSAAHLDVLSCELGSAEPRVAAAVKERIRAGRRFDAEVVLVDAFADDDPLIVAGRTRGNEATVPI